MTGPDEPGVRRAWGWVDHLRSGGTTPWASWTRSSAEPGGRLPGARQLELLRKLNQAGPPSARLAARVLSAATLGRGATELPLLGVAASGFGPPPVDPATLGDEDLLRVALPLLVQDLLDRDPATEPPVSPAGEPSTRPRRLGRSFRLVGDPGLAEPLREHLRARGRPPGGPRPRVFVVGAALDRMLAHAWAERCFDGGGPAWAAWLARAETADALPPRIDLPAVADRWAAEVGASRVAVVLDPQALVPLLRLDRPVAEPAPTPAGAAELARRLGPLLRLRLPDDRRRAVLRGVLRPALAEEGGDPPAIPADRGEWVERRAAAMQAGLAEAGYAVHGGANAVLPVKPPRAGAVSYDAHALAAGIRLLLRFDRELSRSPEEDG